MTKRAIKGRLFAAIMMGTIMLTSAFALGTQNAYATTGFQGDYVPSNWAFLNTNADGSVDTSGAPDSIKLTGGDLGFGSGPGNTDYTVDVAGNSRCVTISFDWVYVTTDVDGPLFDPAGYTIDGSFTQVTDNVGLAIQTGSTSVSVSTDSVFGFRVHTTDNGFGEAMITVSNFETHPGPCVSTNSAPPSNPPDDAPRGKPASTPQGACDALVNNSGKGQGKQKALENNCGVVAEDDVYEFTGFITFANVLDNDLNKLTSDNTGLTVIGVSDVVDSLPPGSLFVVGTPDGSFGVLCAPGVGTLTFTYTAANSLGLSDTADVTVTCL